MMGSTVEPVEALVSRWLLARATFPPPQQQAFQTLCCGVPVPTACLTGKVERDSRSHLISQPMMS